MSDFNVVTDARLSAGAYRSNNQSGTPIIDDWRPVELEKPARYDFSETFGAQLYEKDGLYKVAFRGTEGNLPDWATNLKYGTFQWSDEFRDAVVFVAKAVVRIAEQTSKPVEEAAKLLSTTGHSQGGFLSELAALMFAVKGTSLDVSVRDPLPWFVVLPCQVLSCRARRCGWQSGCECFPDGTAENNGEWRKVA